VSPLSSPALIAKNNEIEQLKARIMEWEKELTSARNTARPKNERVLALALVFVFSGCGRFASH
jgi:hypothetical protein